MKKLLIILLLLFIPNITQGEEIPPYGCGYEITRETNPIYWGYMEDYGAKLKQALDKSHMFRIRYMGASYIFVITRDGQIKDMRISTSQGKYFNRKVKEIIESVPPLPFREGMNLDEMLFKVYLGYELDDMIRVGIGYHLRYKQDIFHIMVTTSK